MEQITRNVFAETKIRGCNPGIVLTDEGAVFIDTAQWITKLLEMRKFALERGPIKCLINTESHIDHIFGNHTFELFYLPGHSDADTCTARRYI